MPEYGSVIEYTIKEIQSNTNDESEFNIYMMQIYNKIKNDDLFTMRYNVENVFNDNTKLSNAFSGSFSADMQITRPEIKTFATQKQLLVAQQKLTNAAAIPKLSLSAEGNYGRPGPNFFNTNLRFYGQAGINIRWNVGTLYNFGTQKRNLSLRQKMVDAQIGRAHV